MHNLLDYLNTHTHLKLASLATGSRVCPKKRTRTFLGQKYIINFGGYVVYLEFSEKYFVKLALETFDNIIMNVETVSKAKTGKNRLY